MKLADFTVAAAGLAAAQATHTEASFLLLTKHTVQSHEPGDFLNISVSGTAKQSHITMTLHCTQR